MKQYIVTLSEWEKDALVQIIDVAVKAQGLNVAEAGIVLTRKVLSAREEIVEDPAYTAQAPVQAPQDAKGEKASK